MASGNLVGVVLDYSFPATNAAVPGARAGGSTNNEAFPIVTFDPSTDQFMDYVFYLTDAYSGGGLDVEISWVAVSATSGNVRIGAAIRRLDSAENITTSHTYSFNEVTSAANGTNGVQTISTISFTSGADMDSLVAGEKAVLRIYRDADNVTLDTMAGGMSIIGAPVIKES